MTTESAEWERGLMTVSAELEQYLHRLLPREVRHRYFQKRNGPMFIWTVEPFNLRDKEDKANGKYESVVYVPYGKGSRTGKATRWQRDESTASLHALRKDAKARALRLYRKWESKQV